MSKRTINIKEAPAAIGPYVQGIALDNVIYFSGQLGLDPSTTKMVEGGVEAEAKQVIKNIDALLKSEGLTAKNVVKTLVLLTDMADFATVNKIYADYFGDFPPARSCFAVKQLPLGGLVEIEFIATRN
ncbi:MAG: Rid family detoxifying hydrolase [Firmicutes bacterium]|nr:Rid family detoxifying hydrolase [Bacillota bacterium]